MYKNYVFDLYGTLIDLYTDEEKDEFWHKLQLFFSYNGAYFEQEELKETYLKMVQDKIDKFSKKTEAPDVKIIKIMKKLYKLKAIYADEFLLTQTMQTFRILSTESMKLYDGVIELLARLKAEGKKIYILSNGQAEFSIPEMKHLGIYDYFDGIYFSADYQICKPDVKFFKKLIKEEKINISESIMIGNDYRTDIEIANRLNMDSLYIYSNHSPEFKDDVKATYCVYDGDFTKVKDMILEK